MNVSDSGSSPKTGRSQDFDLNLAPIIDCFTVLITFMLASASFLAIGVLDSNVAVPGQPAPNAQPPPIQIEVELRPQREILVRVTGKEKLEKRIPGRGEEWNTTELVTQIDALRKRWTDVQSLVLSASDDIEYLHIVRLMEVLKAHVPSILLGGM